MSAVRRDAHHGLSANATLLARLQAADAVILTRGDPPWQAVPFGDARRRPLAWVTQAMIDGWQREGYAVRDAKGWRLRRIAGPRPILADTPDGPRPVQVRENWMQRLARDLGLEGPLAEAGHRLVADGLRLQIGAYRTGGTSVVVDTGARTGDAEEARIHRRIDARRRVREALADLAPLPRACAEGVCLNDRSLDEVASAQHLTHDEAAQQFTLALLKLARFYGTLPGVKRR